MGTVLDLRIKGGDKLMSRAVDEFVAGQVARLEGVFSVFDDDSELCRWRRGEVLHPSDEFCELMGLALAWHRRSAGLFNPLTGQLTQMWRRAEQAGCMPGAADLAEEAASIAEPRFELLDRVPVPLGDCTRLSLNAIAKGYIVDRVVEAALRRFEIEAISLNAGGDVLHRGSPGVAVGIENPLRPYDNEPPLVVIHLQDQAIATSGSSRRGFRIGDAWYSHVIDPRSGQPALGPASVSVVADDAITADVAATVACILDPPAALDWLAESDELAGLVVDRDGTPAVDPHWGERFGSIS